MIRKFFRKSTRLVLVLLQGQNRPFPLQPQPARALMNRILLAVLLLLTACGPSAPEPTGTPTQPVLQDPTATATQVPGLTATPPSIEIEPPPVFASFRAQPVTIVPSLQQDRVDPDFGNVLVPLALSPEQMEGLAAQGVVASPRDYPEFHNLYNETAEANLPVFVTSDALLHTYHLIFDELLSSLEEQVFLLHLRELNQALLEQTAMQYEQLKGTAWEDPARRVYAYVAVGSRLADPDFQVPDPVKDLAEAELALIDAASGPSPSPIFSLLKYGEDYSQYIPRGHYTKSDPLQAYFRSMMWYGRMTFRLGDPKDPAVGPTETRMALLLSLAVRDGKAGNHSALDLWQELYDPTAFLVGRSDDLNLYHYLGLMDAVYGPHADVRSIAEDAGLETFLSEANDLPAPRILGLLSDDYKPVEATKGLRLMGQRFVPDAYIFQKLIHPNVSGRFLPSGLDVMAVMGSERAAVWLAEDPSTQSAQYADQFDELTGWLGALQQEEWVETAYNGWLYTLRPLLSPPGEGYPLFMQSTAWQDKQLNTALGSWAELKHDTILYAKQAYGGIGGCGWPSPPAPVTAQSYVEPVPEVFARIAALAEMTRQGLDERGLLQLLPEEEFAPTLSDRLDSLASQALDFKAMAEKELRGQSLTEEEQSVVRSFGNYMEEVVVWANGEKPELDPAAIVADVATDPNSGNVLEVGVGNVHEIYVVAPIPQENGSLAITVARGAIFSYYEFPSPERLTDEAWRAQVANDLTPAQPAFTGSFSVPEAARLDIQAAIYRIQRDWANWIYLTSGYNGTQGCPIQPSFLVPVSNEVQRQATQTIAALKEQNQYEGRQWISSDYLSIEPSATSPNNVIVTVRETWKDYLVTYEGSDPFAWFDLNEPEPITAHRGPYTVDIAYELAPRPGRCDPSMHAYNCYQWNIVSFTELTERPAWRQP